MGQWNEHNTFQEKKNWNEHKIYFNCARATKYAEGFFCSSCPTFRHLLCYRYRLGLTSDTYMRKLAVDMATPGSTQNSIYDLCFNPEGTQLVVGVSSKVLVYDAINGSLLQPLRGHKDNVYCVNYARDGKKFASGSADKTVIIWNSKLEGILKYTHNDAIQCLQYNPVTHVLVSCALSDFGFWTGEQKSVQKHKAHARITSCSWTCDGLYLALGLASGAVSIRNRAGEEKGRIERPGGAAAPIWTIAWSPVKEDGLDVLCIGDWAQTLSFYTLGGKQIGKERNLGYDPLRVSYYPGGEYVLVSGSGKTCELYSNQGIRLGDVGEPYKSWVWCVAPKPNSAHVALGCQDGTIAFLLLNFSTVHGLYKERYACRENMTDVIIQHLITEQRVRIKCRDLIKKIAIYKDRLAVQLPERVVIYELSAGDSTGMHYKVKEKINATLECSMLVVCSQNIVLCQDNKLECLTLDGRKEREWIMDSAIRYIKVVGGPPKQEGLFLGLKGGEVYKVFVDNPFPKLLAKVPAAVKCLDLSMSRTRAAVVDEMDRVHVVDARTGALFYQEPNAGSAAWNAYWEDIIAFSNGEVLSIKAGDFAAHHHNLPGMVVGLCGSKLFCLNGSNVTTAEIPLSAPMYQYIEKKQFMDAYHVACLGIPDEDWEELANAALDNLDFTVATLSFTRVKNLRYLQLTQDLHEKQKKGDKNKDLLLAEIYAFRGKYKEAARLYMKSGHEERALTMFTDLRMFDAAQEYLGADGSVDQKVLLRKKAEWAKNINEPRAAAEMYLTAGDIPKAVEIFSDNRWIDSLIDVGRKLDKVDRENIELVASALTRLGALQFAIEMHRKIGEDEPVLNLHVQAHEWPEAFALANKHAHLKHLVYVPYAQWLAENDRFVEAQKAFHAAGRPDEAFRVLEQLTLNAVQENRFQDAGYYYWVLGQQCLDIAAHGKLADCERMVATYYEKEKLAAIYYAYDIIQRYIDEPFTSYMPEALFNVGRFLLNETKDCKPKGVSQFAILYALSKQAMNLGAFKLARQVLDRIQGLRVPLRFQEYVDLSTVIVRARPYHDAEEMLPMCYRCSTFNPLLTSTKANVCSNCHQPFVHSFVSFEALPLVEFTLEDGVSDEEAVRLIETPPARAEGVRPQDTELVQTMQLDDGAVDPFTAKVLAFEKDDDEINTVVVNRAMLLDLERSSVIVCKRSPPLRYRYYRNLIPDLPVIACHSCHKAFLLDDYEMQILQRGHCPFCRSSNDMKDTSIDTAPV